MECAVSLSESFVYSNMPDMGKLKTTIGWAKFESGALPLVVLILLIHVPRDALGKGDGKTGDKICGNSAGMMTLVP